MDRNTHITLFTSQTGSGNSPIFTNDAYRGGHFIIRLTSAAGTTAATTFTVQGLVPGTTGTFYTILASTPATAEGTVTLKVYPGLSTDANAVANDILPARWRFNVAHTGTQLNRYSIGASLGL